MTYIKVPCKATGGNGMSIDGTSSLATVNAAAVRYRGIHDGAVSPSEGAIKSPMPACTLKKLYVYVYGFTLDSGCTVTIRKNGVDTALTVAILSTGLFSKEADVSFAENDYISIGIDATPSASGLVQFNATVKMEITAS